MDSSNFFRSIPYTARVRESGEEPAIRKNAKKMDTPGIIESVGAQFQQNSISGALWRWGSIKRARWFGERAPDGWDPREHISGFFKEYTDYLLESENPEELELRKNYVIQRINYERLIAQIGPTKQALSAFAGTMIDPFSWVIGGPVGGQIGRVSGAIAARIGLSRIGSGVLTGAATGAAMDVIDTSIKRVLDGSQVEEPEYRPISNMLFGGVVGGIGGFLSDSAGFARFKLQHGSDDFYLYRASELESRRLELGTYKGLSASDRIDRRKYINKQIQNYITGEKESNEYRAFDIGGAVDRERAIGQYLDVFGLRKGSIGSTAAGMNRLRSVFSNQMNLLTSPLDSLRVAGMKIFPTETYEKGLELQVGNGTPLIPLVAQANAKASREIVNGLRDGFKLARDNGFRGSKEKFKAQVFDALQDASRAMEVNNPGVRYTVDIFNGVNRESAEWLYRNGGFEFQKLRKERFNKELEELFSEAEKQYGYTRDQIIGNGETPELKDALTGYRRAYQEIRSNYERDMSGGLEEALKRFGGAYFPRELDGFKVQGDLPGAQYAVRESMLKGEEKYLRDRANMVWQECLDMVSQDEQKNLSSFWKALNRALKRYGLNDVFECPKIAGKGFVYHAEEFHPSRLQMSASFRKMVEEQANERIRSAIDRAYPLASGSRKYIRISESIERANMPAETHPRGSAKHRHYHDDYDTIRPFLQDDLVDLEDKYIKTMHASAGMIECIGDENGERLVDQIVSDYREQVEKLAGSGKDAKTITRETAHLQKRTKAGLRALEATLNHIKGYGSVAWNELGNDSIAARTAGIISNWNIARYLSDCIFSQFQDQANVALHLNGWRTFGQSLVNFTKLLYNGSYRKELRELIADLGVASDLYMKSERAQQLISISESAGFLGGVERASGKLADLALKASQTGRLDAWTQSNAAYMTGCELVRTTRALANNKKLSGFQARFLKESGLSSKDAKIIGEQIKQYASKEHGVVQLNLGEWGDQEAADKVRKILYEHAVGATMVPGADLPPLFRSPLGKMLLQFRSFATATFNKMFMYSLENGGSQAANTIAQCMLMDTFGKVCKSIGKFGGNIGEDPVSGKLREFDALDCTMRAFNDSITGNDWSSWAMDPLGIMQAITHPRSPSNQFGGVSAGLIRDIGGGVRVFSNLISGGTSTASDKRAAWRLLPFQNWWLIRGAIATWNKLNK